MDIKQLNVSTAPSVGNPCAYGHLNYVLLNNLKDNSANATFTGTCREALWNSFRANNSVAVIALDKFFTINYKQFEENINYFFELYGEKVPEVEPIKMICGNQNKLCFLIKSLPQKKDIVKLSALIGRLSICTQAFNVHPVVFFKYRFFTEKNYDSHNWKDEIPKGKKLIFTEKMKSASKLLAKLAFSDVQMSEQDLKEFKRSVSKIKIISSEVNNENN